MGTVFLAWDLELRREVALKVLELSATPELRERVGREARALAQVRVPQVPEVYDFSVDGERPWIAEELIPGADLATSPPPDAVSAYLEVARALRAIHAADLVHRDVKPANVLRTPLGRVVLVDFGLVRGDHLERLTREGHVVGTPAFLAPEIFQGAEGSPGSDLYSWGVSLFSALEGRLPFPSFAHVEQARLGALELRFASLPPSDPLRSLLARCLAPNPARRPSSAAEVCHELGALIDRSGEGASHQRRRRRRRTITLPAPARRTARLALDPDKMRAPGPAVRGARDSASQRRRAGRAPRGLRAGGGILAGAAFLAWALVHRSGPSGAPEAPSSATPPVPPRAALSGELEAALEGGRSGNSEPPFLLAYRRLGAGAYEELPGQRAWMAWLESGGRPEDLESDARDELRAASAVAEARGLVLPFGPGWRLESSLRMAPLEVLLERAFEASGRQKRSLELLAARDASAFPGPSTSALNLLPPKVQLGRILDAAGQDFESRRSLDGFLATCRSTWTMLLALAIRALEEAPAAPAAALQERTLTTLRLFRYAMHGSVSGARVRRLMGLAPRSAAGRCLELAAGELLADLAESQGISAASSASERIADWSALAADGSVSESLRSRAWLEGLRVARRRGLRDSFGQLYHAWASELEGVLDTSDRAWLIGARSWWTVTATRGRSPAR